MAKLIISFEGAALKTVPLNKDRITIGRRPENDIQVDNLGVSGEHAAIVTMQNDSVIEDLKSTNGTLVNGQLVEKRLLQNNDVIEIGKHKIKYVAEPVAAASAANFEKTMVIRRPGAPAPSAPSPEATAVMPATIMGSTGSMKAKPQATEPATLQVAPAPKPVEVHAADSPSRPAALQVLSGDAAGRVLDLTKSLTTIGKKGVQVVVFTRRPTGYFVTHVEGDAFPMFNGAPLGPEARQLKDNDTIEITGIKMSFFYKP
jgi:pSer/pThr/pTyr-binding forkhead associated (FHA) protein